MLFKTVLKMTFRSINDFEKLDLAIGVIGRGLSHHSAV